MDTITKAFSTININEEKNTNSNEEKIIKIQRTMRNYIFKLKHLPLILYRIKYFLEMQSVNYNIYSKDGRINSSIYETNIIELISKNFPNKIKIPKCRMWYDLLVYDTEYNWIPVNIKITNTNTSDNTGNLAMCVYSYTDEILDLHSKNTYTNGIMSDILFNKIKNKMYNYNHHKDYYFIILNKCASNDIIINSIKGLTKLTPNINNLPFQVCWDKNREYNYKPIEENIKLFIDCLQKPNPSWSEKFMTNIRSIRL